MKILRETYLKRIRTQLQANFIVALLGPRQSGKTAIAREIQGIDASVSPSSVHFFDLESPSDFARLRNPEMTLSRLPGLIILDEIQKMPELLPLLRNLADRETSPAQFLIIGDASPTLLEELSNSLAGRVSILDVSGFSLSELGVDSMDVHWWRGGFPGSCFANSDEAAQHWQEDYVRTFLERDLPQLGITIPAITLRRFWTMVAHSHGQIVKFSELARSLGCSEPTARRYLDIFTETHMVRALPPWTENLKKRQVKAPKVYIRDSGLAHCLLGIPNPTALEFHPKIGASWEGYCLEQILAATGDHHAYFWATHGGAELDLLLFHQGQRLGFEFKHTEKPSTSKSMRSAQEDLRLDHLYVVHPGIHSFSLDTDITATTLPDFIRFF